MVSRCQLSFLGWSIHRGDERLGRGDNESVERPASVTTARLCCRHEVARRPEPGSDRPPGRNRRRRVLFPSEPSSATHAAGSTAFEGAPPEVAAAGNDQWPLPGHDYDNTREAGQSPINARSIGGLVPAWTVPMTGALTTAPIILGRRVYVEDDLGSVAAIDRSTGHVVWRTKQTGISIGPDGVGGRMGQGLRSDRRWSDRPERG